MPDVVALRPVEDADLDALFDQMRDPRSVWMAAFTAEDPNDRAAFDAHMARVRASLGIPVQAVTRDSQLVGSIASFVIDGRTEVTYWIDRAAWGCGIASRALALLLDLVRARQNVRQVSRKGKGWANGRAFRFHGNANASIANIRPVTNGFGHYYPTSREPFQGRTFQKLFHRHLPD